MIDQIPHYLSPEDKAKAAEAEKAKQKRLAQQKDDLKVVLKTLEGRRFLWRLMIQCRVFESIAFPTEQIQYSAGQQDIGHFIHKLISNADKDAFLQMLKESTQGEYNV